MPRFYFHLHNGLGLTRDEEGSNLETTAPAEAQAVAGARSLLSSEVCDGTLDLRGRIEVTDETGRPLFTTHFRDVVEIVDGELPPSGAPREAGA